MSIPSTSRSSSATSAGRLRKRSKSASCQMEGATPRSAVSSSLMGSLHAEDVEPHIAVGGRRLRDESERGRLRRVYGGELCDGEVGDGEAAEAGMPARAD